MLLPNSGKLLALDLGKHYTGVAVSDPSQRVVFPREEIKEKDASVLQSLIVHLIESESIVGVVVGLPTNSRTEETQQSAWVRKLITGANVSIPVFFADEAYTSVALELEGGGRKDSVVAQKLLEKVLGL